MRIKEFLEKTPVKFALELVDLYFSKHVARSAAQLAYFLTLSFFPALVCVNAFIGLLNLDPTAVLSAASAFLPRETLLFLRDYINYVSSNLSPAMLAAGLAMTLMSASAAFRGLMNIMGEIYGRRSYRGVWQIIASLGFSVLFLSTVYLSIVVLFTGEWLVNLAQRLLSLKLEVLPLWKWLRFPLLFAMVFCFVLLVYRMSAPRGRPKPPTVLGAFFAAVALVVASAIFSLFIGLSSRFSLIYGSLASLIILLLWLYLCGTILIMGNAFNCVWYRRKKQVYLQKMYDKQSEDPQE